MVEVGVVEVGVVEVGGVEVGGVVEVRVKKRVEKEKAHRMDIDISQPM